jgi:ABC-type glycerol-3-phosphate transport system substrate-binding protein
LKCRPRGTEFIDNCAKFKEAGIDCVTTGTKALWPGAGIFDYMNLRTNGYDFHMDLTAGKVAWTDDRVKNTFAEWAKLVEPGYITANHAALDWQDAASLLIQGKAANYVMGNFAVGRVQGRRHDRRHARLHGFPEITPGLPRGEEAPTDTIHIPAGAKNVDDAKKFLAFIATADVQTKLNEALGQLPVNNQSKVGDDPFLRPVSRCSRRLTAASRSSSTATRRPRWPRSAWKASRSSWSGPKTSTRSLSGSKKPASASTSKLHDRAANNPPPGHFGTT